jgi:hypothetical protein
MTTRKQQENDAGSVSERIDHDADAAKAQAEAEALNDARALQQMIEGTPDASDEFRRIEQKR